MAEAGLFAFDGGQTYLKKAFSELQNRTVDPGPAKTLWSVNATWSVSNPSPSPRPPPPPVALRGREGLARLGTALVGHVLLLHVGPDQLDHR